MWTSESSDTQAVSNVLNGNRIAYSSNDTTAWIWDLYTGDQMGKSLQGPKDLVTSVAFSRDGLYVVSGSANFTIRMFDAQTGTPGGKPFKGHKDVVRS